MTWIAILAAVAYVRYQHSAGGLKPNRKEKR